MPSQIMADRTPVRADESTQNTEAPALNVGTAAETAESILHQALRGEALPPAVHDIWFDLPSAGSFDAGIARVMGEQHVFNCDEYMRARGLNIVISFTDVTGAIAEEVKRSYGFARYAVTLTSAFRNEDGDTAEVHQQAVEHELSKMAATAFLAGWYMGQEHHDAKSSARTSKGTVPELVDLFRRKIHIGAIPEDALTSGGEGGVPYWSDEQIREAQRIIHKKFDPEGPDAQGLLDEQDGALQAPGEAITR